MALEQDNHEGALELLLAEIAAAEDGRRERLLRHTVGLFADLGEEHPLTAALPAKARRPALLMSAAATTTMAVRPKAFHFPLSVEWIGERRVAAQVEGKPTIEIAPPPVFRGTDPAT